MNDWYNTNEHRSYPFIENHDEESLKRLPYNEILDCRFFLKNVKSNLVYLKSREELENEVIYTFGTSDVNINPTFRVEKNAGVQVIKDGDDRWYGFCVFGNIESTPEEPSDSEQSEN